MERLTRFELVPKAWKAFVLAINTTVAEKNIIVLNNREWENF